MKLIQLDRTNDHHLSLWFWRKKNSDGKVYHSRTFNIAWMFRIWKENKVKPQWGYHSNKANKNAGDRCFDASFALGYLILNYTNWDL